MRQRITKAKATRIAVSNRPRGPRIAPPAHVEEKPPMPIELQRQIQAERDPPLSQREWYWEAAHRKN
jgi:hypothetical protein